ncbi:hypothetical protein niasHT_026612 [Heterodera trifolii]|uniref:Uncharacterized protein n=1 Tax=Heterodera trifolii TaxID=157864 RepID=A0ABD2KSY7_9BILA
MLPPKRERRIRRPVGGARLRAMEEVREFGTPIPALFQPEKGQHFCIPIAGTQISGIPIAGTQFSGIPITWTQTQQSFGIPITGLWHTIIRILSQHFCIPIALTQFSGIPIAGTQFSGIPIAGTQFSGIPITWTQTQQSFDIRITGTCLTNSSSFLSPGLNPQASQSLGFNYMPFQ